MMNKNEIIFYTTESGNVKVEVLFENETVWLSQAQIAVLFAKARSTITEHINNIFEESELVEDMVCRYFRHTTQQ